MTAVYHLPDGSAVPHAAAPRPAVVLSGSFNPLHAGHRALAAAAARRVGGPAHFELSVANVDKPELLADEAARRVRQFAGLAPVWVTRAATFDRKADLFPGAAFAVGWDTAVRLIDPRYYGGDPGRRDAALRALLARGCRVVVGGRADADGRFRTWDEVGVDPAFLALFDVIPEADFRLDVSSTALRRGFGERRV